MILACRLILFLALFYPLSGYSKCTSLRDAFSPHQGATALVIQTIEEAQKSIRVAAYSFTSRPIADALVAAHNRGVDVMIVLDKSQRTSHNALFLFLRQHGIPTRINDRYAIMHNKFMVIDYKVLELGSFNYTGAAEDKNAENVLVVHNNQKIISDYIRQWRIFWYQAHDK